jgi:hypothetical protein
VSLGATGRRKGRKEKQEIKEEKRRREKKQIRRRGEEKVRSDIRIWAGIESARE